MLFLLQSNDYWHNPGDDILDSILFNQDLDFLPDNDLLSSDNLDVASSECSDSGTVMFYVKNLDGK